VVKALASGASHASGVGSSPTLFTILFCWFWVQGVSVVVAMLSFFGWRWEGHVGVVWLHTSPRESGEARALHGLGLSLSGSGGGVDEVLSSGWLLYLLESF
jgi:hypothetical protein